MLHTKEPFYRCARVKRRESSSLHCVHPSREESGADMHRHTSAHVHSDVTQSHRQNLRHSAGSDMPNSSKPTHSHTLTRLFKKKTHTLCADKLVVSAVISQHWKGTLFCPFVNCGSWGHATSCETDEMLMVCVVKLCRPVARQPGTRDKRRSRQEKPFMCA